MILLPTPAWLKIQQQRAPIHSGRALICVGTRQHPGPGIIHRETPVGSAVGDVAADRVHSGARAQEGERGGGGDRDATGEGH